MKIHDNSDPSLLCVAGYGDGYVTVGEQHIHDTFVLTPTHIHLNPGVVSVQTLIPGSLPMLADSTPEILLIGTGREQQVPPLEFIADLAMRRIGVEHMDTPAACRTFNILVLEQRRVAALLFVDK